MIRYWEENTETEIGRPFDLEKHDKEISNKWLDKVKKAREEIEKQSYPESDYGFGYGKDKVVSMDLVWEILDKLIESEGK